MSNNAALVGQCDFRGMFGPRICTAISFVANGAANEPLLQLNRDGRRIDTVGGEPDFDDTAQRGRNLHVDLV